MKKVFWVFFALVSGLLVFAKFSSPSSSKKKEKFSPKEEKPFVIIIPSYNNSRYCEQNIRSVLSQNYNNYRVIYIDDASKDDTYEKVKNVVAVLHQESRVELIKNTTNQGALANIYSAVHTCNDREIIVTVDGDDFLAHEEVLLKLNQAYANPNVWMTYGNYLDYPSYKQRPLICKKIPNNVKEKNAYRTHEWVSSHLRTFYAGLFKQIKLQDFLYKGTFLPMGWDLAFMLPLLEMSGERCLFIQDTLYLYNRTNPLSDHKQNFAFQNECASYVRSLPHYPRLLELPKKEDIQEMADLAIFSFDRPLQLYAFLESLSTHVTGLKNIWVIYRCSSEDFLKAYKEVSSAFPHVSFLQESNEPKKDFRSLFLATAFNEEASCSDYVLFAVDDIIVKDKINLTECIQSMKTTGAYGFYLGYGKHLDYCYMLSCNQGIPKHVSLGGSLHAWQFQEGIADWKYPNSLDMVLYRKKDIKKDLHKAFFFNPNTLEAQWALKANFKGIGLFYTHSKVVNVPLNLVNISTNRNLNSHSPEQLLAKFNEGLKIDIAPLFQIHNNSRHISYEPSFVLRNP